MALSPTCDGVRVGSPDSRVGRVLQRLGFLREIEGKDAFAERDALFSSEGAKGILQLGIAPILRGRIFFCRSGKDGGECIGAFSNCFEGNWFEPSESGSVGRDLRQKALGGGSDEREFGAERRCQGGKGLRIPEGEAAIGHAGELECFRGKGNSGRVEGCEFGGGQFSKTVETGVSGEGEGANKRDERSGGPASDAGKDVNEHRLVEQASIEPANDFVFAGSCGFQGLVLPGKGSERLIEGLSVRIGKIAGARAKSRLGRRDIGRAGAFVEDIAPDDRAGGREIRFAKGQGGAIAVKQMHGVVRHGEKRKCAASGGSSGESGRTASR